MAEKRGRGGEIRIREEGRDSGEEEKGNWSLEETCKREIKI